MKKKLLFGIALVPSLMIQAQTITVDDTLSTVNSMNYYAGDTSVTSYDSENGAMASWDYSMLYAAEGSTGSNLDTIINRVNSTYSADYPMADYEENFDGGVSTFFSNTPDSVVTHGFVFSESGTDYKIMYDVNPLKSLALPTSLGTTFTDDISGNATSDVLFGQVVAVSGTATVNADATGTLTLPGNNVYSDVIRIKTVESLSGTIPPIPGLFAGGDVFVTRTSYIYYSPSTSDMPVFIYGSIDAEFATIGTVNLKTVWSKDELEPAPQASLGEITEIKGINIYPNPANNIVNISSEQVENITIQNTLGEVVYNNTNPSTNIKVDVSTLARGVYFVKFDKNNITSTKKLVIK